MIIWIEVTKDEYELPIAVADSAGELANLCGTTKNAVTSSAYRKGRKGRKGRFRRVDIQENDNVDT